MDLKVGDKVIYHTHPKERPMYGIVKSVLNWEGLVLGHAIEWAYDKTDLGQLNSPPFAILTTFKLKGGRVIKRYNWTDNIRKTDW